MGEIPVAVRAFIRDRHNNILLVRRGSGEGRGNWSLPGGKPKKGENMVDAVTREIGEELEGLHVRKLKGLGSALINYGGKLWQERYYSGRATGKLRPDMDEVNAARYVSPSQIAQLPMVPGERRQVMKYLVWRSSFARAKT